MSTIAALLASLSLLLGGTTATETTASSAAKYPMAKYASTSAKDGVLKKGCANYRYHYRVKPPTEIWALETFLVDKRGHSVASRYLVSGADPTSGSDKFHLCRANTVPGRFTIRARLTYKKDAVDNGTSGWAKPSHFRLRAKR